MVPINNKKYYIFYDGNCGFCNFWVQWILKNDSKDLFLFSALQSDFGKNFLTERNLEAQQLSTLYLWKPNAYYLQKSAAVFRIAQLLGRWYSVIAVLRFLPTVFGDAIYNLIAKNRHRLKGGACELPSPVERKKFID